MNVTEAARLHSHPDCAKCTFTVGSGCYKRSGAGAGFCREGSGTVRGILAVFAVVAVADDGRKHGVSCPGRTDAVWDEFGVYVVQGRTFGEMMSTIPRPSVSLHDGPGVICFVIE